MPGSDRSRFRHRRRVSRLGHRVGSKVVPAVLWFRRDLRLRDLPALVDAVQGDGEVLGCYVLYPRLPRTAGPRRLQYLHEHCATSASNSTAGCW